MFCETLFLRADRGRRRAIRSPRTTRLRYACLYAPHCALAHKNIVQRESARIWRVSSSEIGSGVYVETSEKRLRWRIHGVKRSQTSRRRHKNASYTRHVTIVSPDASHAGAPLSSTTHGAGKDGRFPWRRGGHLAGRTVNSANKRVPVCYHGMDYFSGLFERRATKCRVNRRGKPGGMKSHGR